MPSIFSTVRRGAEALEKLSTGLEEAIVLLAERVPAMERLEELELSRARFEAEIEGVLAKANGKLKAAANAEARERTMRKTYAEPDPFAEESEALGPALSLGDAARGPAEEVYPVPVGVAPSNKAIALRAKWL